MGIPVKPLVDYVTMEVLSHALRGAIVASEGKVLYVADYASIEARVVMWLAGEKKALDIFRSGADIYLDMASSIYGYPCNKHDHPKERGMGKIAILGLGYQMGWSKFQSQCADFGALITDEFAQQVVNAYREKYRRVKQMWWDQEAAAITAVVRRGGVVRCGRIEWAVSGRFLYARLPSGRKLAYPDPQIRKRPTPWGEEKNALTFMGVNSYAHQWQRQTTYGGSLVENITQAVARDIMAEAMLRCEANGRFVPVLTVHDEIVTEGAPAQSVQEFEQLVAECPDWATGLPIAAEGWSGFRYHK
jgi:DNA polymerase